MNEKKKTGNTGESLAAEYMMKKGYSIVCRNYIAEHGEIDIVCENGEKIVFVEVKTRKKINSSYGRACVSVDRVKKEHLVSAANEYLYKNKEKTENLYPRIDVVEVYLTKDGVKIEHIENAVTQNRNRGC